jgi:hypothetical protein
VRKIFHPSKDYRVKEESKTEFRSFVEKKRSGSLAGEREGKGRESRGAESFVAHRKLKRDDIKYD